MAQFRFLFTSDTYEETVAFYTESMGLSVVHSWTDHGRGTIVATTGDSQIEIFEGETCDPLGNVALAWEVVDITALYADLVAAGVSFDGPPVVQPWGHLNCTLEAPHGLNITLFTVVGEEL
jgi:catechol 2,3-dioxygenase-like lactoylglutathione lyase family enzyme